ncbi:hypothetical protein [Fimbriiglobus ruber]|uniref:Tyrosine specific protein phosphatases domain-containing protein n=1 Tax=Fimbriiglobus ruber TaxID=1908690 RepID=A0A225DRI3_9BACT|nr:hypothetical protein [Fimbriiglobus ruber]OWK38717.1 hypothetical protein FRUB_07837 [Fimbriiglobus ruber]
MEIRIGSYLAASWLLEQESQQWHTLVLLDSGKDPTDFVAAHARSFHFLRFDDIEEPRSGKQLPSRMLIEQGLDFAKGKDKLLVSCRAGQGRSVAMAYVIHSRESGAAAASPLLDPTRHRPNRLVVEIGSQLLGTPAVLDHFDAWRRTHAHIKLADYYDDMEREFEALVARGAVNRICGP